MDKNILEAHWPVLVYRVVRQTLRENPWNAIDAGQLRFPPRLVVKRENLRSWIGHPALGLCTKSSRDAVRPAIRRRMLSGAKRSRSSARACIQMGTAG